MVRDFIEKVSTTYKNASAVKAYAPKLWASLLITVTVFGGVISTNLQPVATQAAAMNDRDANAVVTCAYQSLLNRAPDTAGKKFWMNRYVSTQYDAVSLGRSIAASHEGQFAGYVTPFNTFVKQAYKYCLHRSPSASELTTWGNTALKGTSRADIFAFIVKAGDKPWLFPSEVQCKTMPAGSSVIPLCKANTPGSYHDVAIVNVPESNIYVNKAWSQNIINLRFAAAQNKFYLEAYQDPKVPYPAGSYRSDAAQQWLRDHGYPAARGVSMHQWGLAIDFQCNGKSMGKNAACYNWLKQNAPKYGVFPLLSDIGHFSSNGH